MSAAADVWFDADVMTSLAQDKTAAAAVLSYLGDRAAVTQVVVAELRGNAAAATIIPNARAAVQLALTMRIVEPADLGLHVLDRMAHYQERLAKPGDSLKKHLGEAASLAVAKEQGGLVASDDRDARQLARAGDVKVTVVRTHHLLQRAVRAGVLCCKHAEAARQVMLRAGRRGVSPTDPVC